MKFPITATLSAQRITSTISDASLGIIKINIDDDFTTDAIDGMYIEACGEADEGFIGQGSVTIKLYDKTNSADVTNGSVSISTNDAYDRHRSSTSCKSYFTSKGEIEIHAKVTSTNQAVPKIDIIRLVILMDGDVEKFVVWQNVRKKETYSSTSYSAGAEHLIYYDEDNWDGDVSVEHHCTMYVNDARFTGYSRLYDGRNALGEVSTSSTSPTLQTSSITPVDNTEYWSQGKLSASGGNLFLPLIHIVFKISNSPTKWELMHTILNRGKGWTSPYDQWNDGDEELNFNPSDYDQVTLTHYHEAIGKETGTTNSKKVRLSDDGTGISDTEVDFQGDTNEDRYRESFTEPASDSEMSYQVYIDTAGGLEVEEVRHLILITNAGSEGTNIQLNISDSWKSVDAMQINIGDTWKEVAGAQVNIGDTWKTIF